MALADAADVKNEAPVADDVAVPQVGAGAPQVDADDLHRAVIDGVAAARGPE